MVSNVPLLLVTLLHATAPKPHVVFLLADDLGWANVGWHRDPPTLEVQTPTYVWPSSASFYSLLFLLLLVATHVARIINHSNGRRCLAIHVWTLPILPFTTSHLDSATGIG